jgi:hypothetical protein
MSTNAQSDTMTWGELQGELVGYVETYNSIDAEVATDEPCEECGGVCIYHGRRNDRGSYRAFSECENCGRVIEF